MILRQLILNYHTPILQRKVVWHFNRWEMILPLSWKRLTRVQDKEDYLKEAENQLGDWKHMRNYCRILLALWLVLQRIVSHELAIEMIYIMKLWNIFDKQTETRKILSSTNGCIMFQVDLLFQIRDYLHKAFHFFGVAFKASITKRLVIYKGH